MSASTAKAPAVPTMVVGYVHTASGSAALRWAALEAARIGAELEVVHVFDVDRRADASLAADMDEVRRNAARRADHRARVALDETGADVRVRFTAAEGTLEDVLAAAARGCGRLVLGEPGGHEDATMPARLGARCQVPVTVVSESGEPHQVTPEVTPEP